MVVSMACAEAAPAAPSDPPIGSRPARAPRPTQHNLGGESHGASPLPSTLGTCARRNDTCEVWRPSTRCHEAERRRRANGAFALERSCRLSAEVGAAGASSRPAAQPKAFMRSRWRMRSTTGRRGLRTTAR